MTELERWYLAVSLVLGMGVPIVPAILGHFGADPLLNVWYVCEANVGTPLTASWIQAKDDTTRMKYFILDLVRDGSAGLLAHADSRVVPMASALLCLGDPGGRSGESDHLPQTHRAHARRSSRSSGNAVASHRTLSTCKSLGFPSTPKPGRAHTNGSCSCRPSSPPSRA